MVSLIYSCPFVKVVYNDLVDLWVFPPPTLIGELGLEYGIFSLIKLYLVSGFTFSIVVYFEDVLFSILLYKR